MTTCNWEVIGCDDCGALNNLDESVQDHAKAWAVDRLWKWTQMRFGLCEVSYRPCKRSCLGYGIGGPVLISGNFTNLVCGSCAGSCSCRSVSEVILPGPIANVVEILIDGDSLDLSSVRVDDWNRLVRTDGSRFPTCQDLSKNSDEDGTWQVTYDRGEAIPPGGELVAGILACEYAKSICGDKTCRLPRRVTTVSRQGLTVAVLDDFRGLDKGFTGIWEIDDWIAEQNMSPRPATITSPDVPRPRKTTWTYASS